MPSTPDVPSPEPPEPATATTEGGLTRTFYDNNPGMRWRGTWGTSSNAYDAGGSSEYTHTIGSYVEFDFIGTRVSLVCRIGPTMGNVYVTLVGPMRRDDHVSLYNTRNQYQQVVWSTDSLGGPLLEGHYMIRVEYEEPIGILTTLPSKPRSAFIDGFEMTGYILE